MPRPAVHANPSRCVVLGLQAVKSLVAHGSIRGDDKAQVSTHSVQVVAEAVVNATHAQPHWAARPLEQRQAVLLEFNRLLKEVCVCVGLQRGAQLTGFTGRMKECTSEAAEGMR